MKHLLTSLLVCPLLLGACDKKSEVPAPAPEVSASTPPSRETNAEKRIAGGVGSRVFVVEREREALAVYDLDSRRLLPQRIEGLGNMRHAVMAFSPDLRFGYVATRKGKLSRIDLETLEKAGEVQVSENSIDIAITQDGRFIATAEYIPGGVTLLDAKTLKVAAKLPANIERGGKKTDSRVTGIVDAPGNRLVCVLIEGAEIWVIDASKAAPSIEHRIKTSTDMPYDAMITPNGRHYVVGHMGSKHVSVLDVAHPERGVREVSLEDPSANTKRSTPVKLPHMASWAVARSRVFVPLVGEARLVVLRENDFTFERSVKLRGHPVYTVASPTGAELWVSFSGEADDAFIQVIDTETLEPKKEIRVGKRIYHMDFLPRGSHVLVSANRDNKLALVDARHYQVVDEETLPSPSGVFGAWRAFRIGL